MHPGRQAGASLPNFVIAAEPPSLRLLINQIPLTITLRASGYALSAWLSDKCTQLQQPLGRIT